MEHAHKNNIAQWRLVHDSGTEDSDPKMQHRFDRTSFDGAQCSHKCTHIGPNGELCNLVANFYERGADGKSASKEAYALRSCSSHKEAGQTRRPAGNFLI